MSFQKYFQINSVGAVTTTIEIGGTDVTVVGIELCMTSLAAAAGAFQETFILEDQNSAVIYERILFVGNSYSVQQDRVTLTGLRLPSIGSGLVMIINGVVGSPITEGGIFYEVR